MSLDDTDKAFIEETYEDPDWSTADIAEKLEVTVCQVRGYAKYVGLTRPCRSIDDTSKQFIRETYPDPKWTVPDIAEKLGIEVHQVRGYAQYNGIKRPTTGGAKLKNNWRLLWNAVEAGSSVRRAALKLGYSTTAAQYAMTRMRAMEPGQLDDYLKKRGVE